MMNYVSLSSWVVLWLGWYWRDDSEDLLFFFDCWSTVLSVWCHLSFQTLMKCFIFLWTKLFCFKCLKEAFRHDWKYFLFSGIKHCEAKIFIESNCLIDFWKCNVMLTTEIKPQPPASIYPVVCSVVPAPAFRFPNQPCSIPAHLHSFPARLSVLLMPLLPVIWTWTLAYTWGLSHFLNVYLLDSSILQAWLFYLFLDFHLFPVPELLTSHAYSGFVWLFGLPSCCQPVSLFLTFA